MDQKILARAVSSKTIKNALDNLNNAFENAKCMKEIQLKSRFLQAKIVKTIFVITAY